MAATDTFPNVPYDAANPYTQAISVTPDDNADISHVSRGLMVNASGDVVVVFRDDTQAVTLTLTAGVVYPFRVKRILSTGTTATGITVFL